jgi:hypothetical protein
MRQAHLPLFQAQRSRPRPPTPSHALPQWQNRSRILCFSRRLPKSPGRGPRILAVELAFRTALHSAGAAGLTELLRQPGPVQTSMPCACGSQARYKDMRLKPILTVLGPAKMLRAYYWCSRCRQGQFPADIARDIEDTEYSPGVRRMLAMVGSECSSFDQGRQQMELLADLEVTAKAVERVTEAIGADIGRACWSTCSPPCSGSKPKTACRIGLLACSTRSYHMNLKRTWIWRGSMFCVDTCDGKTLPKLALLGSVLKSSRPK